VKLFRAISLIVAISILCRSASAAESQTSRVVGAANSFLATLNDQQRSAVLFKFDDAKQRKNWSNLPVMFVPRSGLRLKDLNDAQQSAVMALLASVLSDRGMEKVQQIMQGDEMLKSQPDNGPGGGGGPPGGRGGAPGHKGGPPGGGPANKNGESIFGKDLYYISILGTPSEKDPWMVQFGGHHLALNITIAGDHGVLTPTLTGAQPTVFQVNGKTVRPLGAESDKAFALLNALDENQRKQAILNYRVADLVLGPGHDGETIQPEGLKASAMNDQQKAMLLDLISEWANIVNEAYSAERMAEIKSGLDDTYFAWSGSTTHEPGKNGTAYYRIQGPKLVIEFAPQPIGGDLTMHVHTMYRDPTNDYGKAFITK
jgi:hypothetical protein